MYNDSTPELLIGRTLSKIEENSEEEMTFYCTDGEVFRAYHMQDCCENVRIYDTQGNIEDVIGSRITEARAEESGFWPEDAPEPEYNDSFTWTYHTIVVESGARIVVRWLGESNGYYSESVYFQRTHPPVSGFSI